MATADEESPKTVVGGDEVFDISDALLGAAYATFERRRDTPNLSDTERQKLINSETAMRYDADRYRAVGITLLGADPAVSAKSIKEQIMEAKKAIETAKKIRKTIEVAAGLVIFGASVASGQPQAILSSAQSLKKTIKKKT